LSIGAGVSRSAILFGNSNALKSWQLLPFGTAPSPRHAAVDGDFIVPNPASGDEGHSSGEHVCAHLAVNKPAALGEPVS